MRKGLEQPSLFSAAGIIFETKSTQQMLVSTQYPSVNRTRSTLADESTEPQRAVPNVYMYECEVRFRVSIRHVKFYIMAPELNHALIMRTHYYTQSFESTVFDLR